MSHWNEETNEHTTPVRAGFEMWARRLDEQRYPGQAWPPVTRLRRRAPAGRSVWWLATCVTAAAITFAVTLRVSRRPVAIGPLPESVQGQGVAPVATLAAGDDVPVPPVFMVEDLDSYSIIAVTNEMAVVSFATKGGSGPEWLVALPQSRAANAR